MAALVDDLEAHPAGTGPEREGRGLKEGTVLVVLGAERVGHCGDALRRRAGHRGFDLGALVAFAVGAAELDVVDCGAGAAVRRARD